MRPATSYLIRQGCLQVLDAIRRTDDSRPMKAIVLVLVAGCSFAFTRVPHRLDDAEDSHVCSAKATAVAAVADSFLGVAGIVSGGRMVAFCRSGNECDDTMVPAGALLVLGGAVAAVASAAYGWQSLAHCRELHRDLERTYEEEPCSGDGE